MLSKNPPEGFTPKFEVVSCFVQAKDDNNKDKILLLLRQDHKPQPDTWGIPAGKLDAGEDLESAMLRELREETGITLAADDLTLVDTVCVRFPDLDFIQHIFAARLAHLAAVVINPEEHKEFRWIEAQEAPSLDLIQDLDACIDILHQSNDLQKS